MSVICNTCASLLVYHHTLIHGWGGAWLPVAGAWSPCDTSSSCQGLLAGEVMGSSASPELSEMDTWHTVPSALVPLMSHARCSGLMSL